MIKKIALLSLNFLKSYLFISLFVVILLCLCLWFFGGRISPFGVRPLASEMSRLIANGPLAEAYFCGDDVLSIGALSALQASGRKVPEDVGLIGLNDMEMARWNNVNLTTVRQPFAAIVDASIERVAELLEAPDKEPVARLFPCELIERGTLRPLA